MSDSTAHPFDEMEIVTMLLTEAAEKGFITSEQILEALPDAEDNVMLLDTIMEELRVYIMPC